MRARSVAKNTEADELTYCLHIMVRYEIEKQLISGILAVKDVPETSEMPSSYLACPPSWMTEYMEEARLFSS